MTHTPVVIVDSDENRRRTLSLLIRASTQVDAMGFPVISAAFPGFCAPNTRLLPQSTKLFLCPWNEGGEAMVMERIVLGGTGPALLILSDEISSARIAACHKAGNTHLIPSNPLNLNALRTRILLSLEGPVTLAERVSRSGAAMRETLAAFPGLRRRLAIA
jgi:hypothetical protein